MDASELKDLFKEKKVDFESLVKIKRSLDFVLVNDKEKKVIIFELTTSEFESLIYSKAKKYNFLRFIIPCLERFKKYEVIIDVKNYSNLPFLDNVKRINPLFRDALDYINVKYDQAKNNKLYTLANRILFERKTYKPKREKVDEKYSVFYSQEEIANSRLFFRSFQDFKDFSEGTFEFPDLEDERSKQFLDYYTKGIIELAEKDKKDIDKFTVGRRDYKRELESSLEKLAKRLEKESNEKDKRFKGFLPINLTFTKETKKNLYDEVDKVLYPEINSSFFIKEGKGDNSKPQSIVRSNILIFFKKLCLYYLKNLKEKLQKDKNLINADELEKQIVFALRDEVLIKEKEKLKKKITDSFGKYLLVRELFVFGQTSIKNSINMRIESIIGALYEKGEDEKEELKDFLKDIASKIDFIRLTKDYSLLDIEFKNNELFLL